MPKKKQVTFQQSIEGRFIPRSSSPSNSGSFVSLVDRSTFLLAVYPLGATDNRFNTKMVELLTSSSTNSEESPTETSTLSQSKFLRQQIVTMLDTATKSDDFSSSTTSVATRSILKSQPITFGQLRRATIATRTSLRSSVDLEEAPIEPKTNEEQRAERPSTLEQQINSVSPQSSTNSMTIEASLAKFYIHSASSMPNNENRPPPPSYSSSVANSSQRHPIGDASRLSSTLSSKSSSQSLLNLSLSIDNAAARSPPPRYRSPVSSAATSPTFDHEFSRLLYGKDPTKYRRSRAKRKALSDPVK